MKILNGVKVSKVTKGNHAGMRPVLSGALAVMEKVKAKQWKAPKDGKAGKMQDVDEDHIVLYATDSYMFVRVDLGRADDGDSAGPIPHEALVHMERGVYCELGEKEIKCGITRYDRVIAEGYSPDEAKEIPQERFAELAPPKAKRPFRVALNGDILQRMSEAIGVRRNEGVELEFDLEEATGLPENKEGQTYLKPIRARPLGRTQEQQDATEAIIMPIRLHI